MHTASLLNWDTEGRITYFNEYAQQFFSVFKEEEIIGKSAIDTIVPKVESTGRDMDESACRDLRRP